MLCIPTNCWQFLELWWIGSEEAEESVSPASCGGTIEIEVAVICELSGDIATEELFLDLDILVEESTNPFFHFLQNSNRDAMIDDLEETPSLGGLPNFIDYLVPPDWVDIDGL